MSKAPSDQTLHEAYEFIEADEQDEAVAILKPILEQEPDNVDAWWLYAHAVTDAETARMALNQVLKLDASYEEAQALLTKLDDIQPQLSDDEMQPDTPVIPPPSLPEDSEMEAGVSEDFDIDREFALEDDDPIFDDRTGAQGADGGAAVSRKRLLRIVLGVLVILAIIVVIVLLLPQFTGNQQIVPTSTTVAQQAAPTAETAVPTVAPPPIIVDSVPVVVSEAVVAAMSDFDLVENAIGTIDTSLGQTLLASTCASGTGLRDTLTNALIAMAAASSAVEDDTDAIGVAVIDCDTNTVQRIIAVAIEDAVAFATGDLDASAYQARWVAAA